MSKSDPRADSPTARVGEPGDRPDRGRPDRDPPATDSGATPLAPGDVGQLTATSPQHSLEIMRAVLAGTAGPARDVVLLNAGAAIYVAGCAESLRGGIDAARESIDSGEARERLAALIALSGRLSS